MRAGDIPYDPDATVGEAVDAGLVLMVEGKRLPFQPCGKTFPMRDSLIPGGTNCVRPRGHGGVHAFAARWTDQQASAAYDAQLAQTRLNIRQESARRTALADQERQFLTNLPSRMEALAWLGTANRRKQNRSLNDA